MSIFNVSYSYPKTIAYGKKNQFLVKMSPIRMDLYVPAFILGFLFVKSWFLFWGIDLEGVKDLWWRNILQKIKNDHSCWWMVQLFKVPLIIDTDASFDVDDVVAICLAHGLERRGEAKILAIVHDAGIPGMAGNNKISTECSHS